MAIATLVASVTVGSIEKRSREDWSQFRAKRSGVSATTGLPDKFGPENVIWKTALLRTFFTGAHAESHFLTAHGKEKDNYKLWSSA